MTLVTVEAKSTYGFGNGWSLDPWMAVQAHGTETVLDLNIFKNDCWSQDTTAAWRIFLELSDFIHSSPTLFLVSIESHCWAVTALGGYSSQLLSVAWYKHFVLKLGWAHLHTVIIFTDSQLSQIQLSLITFSLLYFYTLPLIFTLEALKC